MSYRIIESDDNKTYKDLLKIKKGDPEKGLFLVEGQDLVDEANKEGLLKGLIVPLNTKAPWTDYPIYGLREALYRNLSSYQSLPVCMGICEKKMDANVGKRVVYLDSVQDPGNVGTIIRTALSFNYSGVVLSTDSVSLYNSKVIQSTKGALFHLPIWRSDLKQFVQQGYNIFVTSLAGEDERQQGPLPEPFVLVFGNEGHGVREEYQALGKKLRIEMSGIDSLNVAVASGIFLYRFAKRG
jgi:TrmH family RNA methyltransferase